MDFFECPFNSMYNQYTAQNMPSNSFQRLPHEIYTFKIYTTKFIQKNLYNLKFIQKKIYTFLKNPKSSHLKYIIAFLNCYIVMRLRG